MIRNRLDILVAVAAFILTNVLVAIIEEPISYHNGLGWDGVHYAKVTEDFRAGMPPDAPQPFVNRIGVPFLASLFESDIVSTWRALGLLANTLALFLLYVLLCFYFQNKWLRLLLLLLFIIPFDSVVRRVWVDAVSTDQWDKVFLFSGLIILHRIRQNGWRYSSILLLSLIGFVGVFFREIVLIIPLAALFVTNPLDITPHPLRINRILLPPLASLIPLAASLLGLCIVKLVIVPQQGEFFLHTALNWLYSKSLPDYLLGWFIAFGPVLILPLYQWKTSTRFLLAHQHLFIYLSLFSILGWIGGSATYRLLQWTMPVIFILVGLAIQASHDSLKRNWLFMALLLTSFLLSQRVLWPLPDAPGGVHTSLVFLTPLSLNPPILDIIGMGNKSVRVLAFVSYMMLFATLILSLHPPEIVLRHRRKAEQDKD